MENSEIREDGYFWWNNDIIPSGHFAPGSAIAGTLNISRDGDISLELHGVLPSVTPPLERLFSVTKFSVSGIQGRLKQSGQTVLLNDVHNNGGSVSFGGISHEKFSALSCLVSRAAYPECNTEVVFNKLQMRLDGYEAWMHSNSIRVTRTESSLRAECNVPEDTKYSLSDGSVIEFKHDLFGPFLGESTHHHLELREALTLVYTPSETSTAERLKKQYLLMSNLFLILTGSDYSLDWPTLVTGDTKETENHHRLYFLRSRNSVKPPEIHNAWIQFSDVKSNFGHLYESWQLKHEELGPGMSLYLGTRRGMRLYVEHRFVNLIWGLESLHRTVNKDNPPTKLEEKVERIIEQVALSKDKNWLRKKLEHSAEPSLAQRLKETIEKLNLNIEKQALTDFCVFCADVRNDISHFGGNRKKEKYDDYLQDILKKTEALSWLYPAILLSEAGLEEHIIIKSFNEGRMAYKIKQVLRDANLSLI